MKVTDTYLAEITDFGLDGKGFSKIEDIAVFTPYTAAGDLAKIKIKKVYKGVAENRAPRKLPRRSAVQNVRGVRRLRVAAR